LSVRTRPPGTSCEVCLTQPQWPVGHGAL